MISHSNLLSDLRARMGAASEDEAERVLAATLVTIGECLTPELARAVAAELPDTTGAFLTAGICNTRLTINEIEGRVASRAGVRRRFAREHLQSVCRTLCDVLPGALCADLERRLGGALFAAALQDRLPETSGSRHDTHLAAGSPGSHHPVSSARAADAAQSHSVVRESNPHGARKVSSGGATTAPSGTLAAGRPTSRHPLSESKPR
jgi:uncharacterized protein (DUF2267 family)